MLKIVLVILVLSFGVLNLTQAQEDNPNTAQPVPIMTGEIDPVNLQWLDEGLQLTFLDGTRVGRYVPSEIETENWYLFDVAQQTLSRSNRWPAQPDIPPTLLNDVEPTAVAFLSPDGRYLIYASRFQPGPNGDEGFIKIYDYQTGLTLDTGIPVGISIRSVGLSGLIWGGNGRFVLSTTPSNVGLLTLPNLYYFDLSSGEVSVRQVVSIELEDQPRRFSVVKIFDVSPDGLQVLMEGGFTGEGISYLAIWDAQTPNGITYISTTQVTDVDNLLDAQFTTSNGSEFVFFNNQGVGRYNVSTDNPEILNNQVNATSYREAKFSPGAEVLALADESAVYWLDLRLTQPNAADVQKHFPTESPS